MDRTCWDCLQVAGQALKPGSHPDCSPPALGELNRIRDACLIRYFEALAAQLGLTGVSDLPLWVTQRPADTIFRMEPEAPPAPFGLVPMFGWLLDWFNQGAVLSSLSAAARDRLKANTDRDFATHLTALTQRTPVSRDVRLNKGSLQVCASGVSLPPADSAPYGPPVAGVSLLPSFPLPSFPFLGGYLPATLQALDNPVASSGMGFFMGPDPHQSILDMGIPQVMAQCPTMAPLVLPVPPPSSVGPVPPVPPPSAVASASPVGSLNPPGVVSLLALVVCPTAALATRLGEHPDLLLAGEDLVARSTDGAAGSRSLFPPVPPVSAPAIPRRRTRSPSRRRSPSPLPVPSHVPLADDIPPEVCDRQSLVAAIQNCHIGYLDTHCHLGRVYRQSDSRAGLPTLAARSCFPLGDRYLGCITNLCASNELNPKGPTKTILQEEHVWASIGYHPKEAHHFSPTDRRNLGVLVQNPLVRAVGEIGLEYTPAASKSRDFQTRVLHHMLDFALECDLPVVIHSRGAEEDCFDILRKRLTKEHAIHWHCYTGSLKTAQDILAFFPNACLGVTPLVTSTSDSRATDIRRLVHRIPLSRLVIETDAPYFVPEALRGRTKIGHPGMVIFVAHEIARVQRRGLSDVVQTTRRNATGLYRL